jgi:hypothetical protein
MGGGFAAFPYQWLWISLIYPPADSPKQPLTCQKSKITCFDNFVCCE